MIRLVSLEQAVEDWIITIPFFWLDSQGREAFSTTTTNIHSYVQ
jgi:hypothetical protein